MAPADHDPAGRTPRAARPPEAAAVLDEDDENAALGSFVCALRESFEEVGLLLADGPVEGLARARCRATRSVPRRPVSSATSCCVPICWLPAGRWVTPLGSPIRFDTRFFLARVPTGGSPIPIREEVAGCRWVAPGEALTNWGRASC